MRTRDALRQPRKYTSDRAIYSKELSESLLAFGVTAEPCRVCERPIKVGDWCLMRPWHVGVACVTCGWWKLDELEVGVVGAAFIEAMRTLGKSPLPKTLIGELKQMGIVERDENNKVRFTACGSRLAREWRARHQEKSA